MTTYLDASGREVTLDYARAYAEERLGRPLTVGEQALDLVGLDVDLREGKERLTAAIEEEKRRAIEDVLAGGPGVLRVTPEMLAVAVELWEAGRRHAREEIARLTGERVFAEVETYTIPRAFYEDHTARRGSVTGRLLRRSGNTVTLALDRTSWEILLEDAEAYQGPLDVQAAETAQILRGAPPEPPREIGGVNLPPPKPLPGDAELGDQDLEVTEAIRRLLDRGALGILHSGRGVLAPLPEGVTPGERRRERALTSTDIAVHAALEIFGPARPMLNAIRVRVNEEARGLLAEQREAGDPSRASTTEELLERLDEKIPGARDAASRIVSGLLIGGIGEMYEVHQSLFPCFIYSAVMDGATCAVCRTYDGRRYHTWSEGEVDLPGGGPNPRCLGDGRCRCRLVPCAPGETFTTKVEPEPRDRADPEIEELRRAVDGFDGLSRDQILDLSRYPGGHSDLVGIDGNPNAKFLESEADMRDIGHRINEEAERRVGAEALGGPRMISAASVDKSRERYAAAIEDESEAFEKAWRREAERRGVKPGQDIFAAVLTDEQWEEVAASARLDPEYLAVLRERERIERDHFKLVSELKSKDAEVRNRLREARLAVLAELRPMGPRTARPDGELVAKADRGGGDLDDLLASLSGVSNDDAADLVRDAARYYPADWVEASNDDKTRLLVSFNPLARGSYNPDGSLRINGYPSTLGDPDGFPGAVHELAHRMEGANAEVTAWEWAFHSRRTVLSSDPEDRKLVPMQDLRPGNYREDETTYPDKFVNPYMGKIYFGGGPTGHWELLSMGMEVIFGGDKDGIDDDMRDFILGLLATAGRDRRNRR